MFTRKKKAYESFMFSQSLYFHSKLSCAISHIPAESAKQCPVLSLVFTLWRCLWLWDQNELGLPWGRNTILFWEAGHSRWDVCALIFLCVLLSSSFHFSYRSKVRSHSYQLIVVGKNKHSLFWGLEKKKEKKWESHSSLLLCTSHHSLSRSNGFLPGDAHT